MYVKHPNKSCEEKMKTCYCGRQSQWAKPFCSHCEERYGLTSNENQSQKIWHWLLARMDANEEALELNRRKQLFFKLLATLGIFMVVSSMLYLIIAIFTLILP